MLPHTKYGLKSIHPNTNTQALTQLEWWIYTHPHSVCVCVCKVFNFSSTFHQIQSFLHLVWKMLVRSHSKSFESLFRFEKSFSECFAFITASVVTATTAPDNLIYVFVIVGFCEWKTSSLHFPCSVYLLIHRRLETWDRPNEWLSEWIKCKQQTASTTYVDC